MSACGAVSIFGVLTSSFGLSALLFPVSCIVCKVTFLQFNIAWLLQCPVMAAQWDLGVPDADPGQTSLQLSSCIGHIWLLVNSHLRNNSYHFVRLGQG